MTEFVAGGRRRIDRVLAPGYLDGIDGLALDEIRIRRAEADQEEVDLSYARRLMQGRIDILKAEQQRRLGGTPAPVLGSRTDEAIVEALKRILADDRRTDHGMGRHLTSNPSRVGGSSSSAVSSYRFCTAPVNSPVSYSSRPIPGTAYVRNSAKLRAWFMSQGNSYITTFR